MNDGLSPHERAELRDLVVAGAQRIRPPRERVRIVAGAVALVLVGAVTGGAVATATLLGSEADPAPTTTQQTPLPPEPSPSTSPTPVPSPEPSTVPAQGVVPFGGHCAAALTDDEVDALRGIDMTLSDYRWQTGANAVLGGIDCVWVSAEAYLSATVHLFAYPADTIAASLLDVAAPGCVGTGETSRVSCTQWADVDGTWLLVRADGADDQITQSGVDTLFAAAAARLADHPRAVPAVRTDTWWSAPDCSSLVAQIDPSAYGYDRVALLGGQQSTPPPERPESIISLLGAAFACDFHFTAGAGDDTRGEVVRLEVVPGGGGSFPSAQVAEGAEPVTVEGAQASVIVPGLDRYEGSAAVLVATDGVNMLMVSPDLTRDTADAAPLAATLLAAMG